MQAVFDDARLRPILDKVEAGVRLSADDGLALYRSADLLAIGHMANIVRERLHGDTTYFNVNRHINPTDVCVASCRLCAFGKRAKDPHTAQGTQRFLVWKRTGFDQHVMRNKGRTRTVQIGVAYVTKTKYGKPCQPKRWVYAFWKIRPPSVTWVQKQYRKRFGIETSYRQMNQARIRTCTRSPLLRLLFIGVALILRNLWVWFHHVVLSETKRGKLCLHLGRLRVRVMLLHLQRFIEAVLECRLNLYTQTLHPPSLTSQTLAIDTKRNY